MSFPAARKVEPILQAKHVGMQLCLFKNPKDFFSISCIINEESSWPVIIKFWSKEEEIETQVW